MDYPPSDDGSDASYDEAALVTEVKEYAEEVSQDPSMLIGHLKMNTSHLTDERAASILVKAIIDLSDDAESSLAEQIDEQRWVCMHAGGSGTCTRAPACVGPHVH